jgi:hypothetical protein
MTKYDLGGSLVTSVSTAVVVSETGAMHYIMKMVSVFALALVAETARRIVQQFWKAKS